MKHSKAYSALIKAVFGDDNNIRKLSQKDIAVIDKTIDSLPKAKQSGRSSSEILRLRFGLGCEKMTLKEIGKMKGVSSSAIYIQETKALRLLRHRPGNRRIFSSFYKGTQEKPGIQELASRIKSVLETSIHDLRLTRRSKRCLKIIGIEKVGDLFQISPAHEFIAEQKDRQGIWLLRIELRNKYGLFLGQPFALTLEDIERYLKES